MITLITNLASAPLKASGVGTRGEDRIPPLADLRAGYQVSDFDHLAGAPAGQNRVDKGPGDYFRGRQGSPTIIDQN